MLDAPLPPLEPWGMLPRPLPRVLVPRTDDIAVTVEVARYWRHVYEYRGSPLLLKNDGRELLRKGALLCDVFVVKTSDGHTG